MRSLRNIAPLYQHGLGVAVVTLPREGLGGLGRYSSPSTTAAFLSPPQPVHNNERTWYGAC